jgi:hypothetical protein
MAPADYVVKIRFGYARFEERWVSRSDGALGIESRTVWHRLDGSVEEIGEWQPPLAWLIAK